LQRRCDQATKKYGVRLFFSVIAFTPKGRKNTAQGVSPWEENAPNIGPALKGWNKSANQRPVPPLWGEEGGSSGSFTS
jgi:hypothetical protein